MTKLKFISYLIISVFVISLIFSGCKIPGSKTGGTGTGTSTTVTPLTSSTGISKPLVPPSGPEFELAILTWVGFGPFYLAQEKGLYDGLNIKITKIEDTAARESAFTSGKIHAMVSTIDLFANEAVSGVPGKAVLKTDDSYGGDGIVVRKDLPNINALKGKTVAYPVGLPSHFFLLYVLDKAGMTSKDIITKEMEAGDAGAAFIAGKVDAAVTWEPWLTKAGTSPNGKILITSKDAPGLIADMIAVHNNVLNTRPGDVEKLLKGWFRAVNYWREHPDESNQIMAKALGLPTEDFIGMISGIKYSDIYDNLSFFGIDSKTFTFDPTKPGRFNDIFDQAGKVWLREGVIKSTVKAETMVDRSPLIKVAKEFLTSATPPPATTTSTPMMSPEECTEIVSITPTGEPVQIYFDLGKATIKPESYFTLEIIGKIMRDDFPNSYMLIEGHTDSQGDEKSNQELSENRALSAASYISNKMGIPSERFIIKGYGESKPIADNNTLEGQAKNRRTEFKIYRCRKPNEKGEFSVLKEAPKF